MISCTSHRPLQNARGIFAGRKGVSHLSVHLRFGTVSIRELAGAAHARRARAVPNLAIGADLARFLPPDPVAQPTCGRRRCFRPEYDRVRWDDAPALFTAWCEARTGYPIVDAAMRQIAHSGYMHNRLRMVVASFLTKDLVIDWRRRGEKYFADALNDFDLSANNGGWQWAASTGCDAQPYFRIFNPVNQSEKFDPDGSAFIRATCPGLAPGCRTSSSMRHGPCRPSTRSWPAARSAVDHPAPSAKTTPRRSAELDRARWRALAW